MDRAPNKLITELAADLEPVRPIRETSGILTLAAAFVLSAAGLVLVEGVNRSLSDGHSSPLFFVATALFAVVGIAAALAVLKMASPRVGNRQDGVRWSLFALSALPFAAVAAGAIGRTLGADFVDPEGFACMLFALAGGVMIGGALVFRLRQGAPVSLDAAGTYTGVAAGALGCVAYAMSCPIDSVGHLGIWHVLPIAIAALIGRLIVPPLIRW